MTKTSKFNFARRCDWDLQTNEITRLKEQLIRQGTDIIDLTVSNPTQCGLIFDQDISLAELSDDRNRLYSAESQGMAEARAAVSQMYAKQGVNVAPERIFLTASTSEAYTYLFRLLANPDDTVLFPAPSYPLFNFLGTLNDVRINFYQLMYDQRWQIDFADLVEQLQPDARAIVLVNPNNPTGSYVSNEEIGHLNRICADRQMAIISDEVFFDFNHQRQSFTSLAGNEPALTFVMGGLSKTLGFPQMKLSWIILSGPDDLVAQARSKLEIIADTFLSVNTPVQNALPQWLAQKAHRQQPIQQRIKANLECLKQSIDGLRAAQLLDVQGGWYAIVRIDQTRTEEEWVLKLLGKYHVFVHPGFFYDFAEGSHLVLSLLPPTERFRDGVERMLSRLEQPYHG